MWELTGLDQSNSPSQPKYCFQPKSDIKAYQVAQIIPLLIAAWKNESKLDNILLGKKIPSSLTARLETLFQFDESLRDHFPLLGEQVDLSEDTNS
jgi:hypothetical protein